MVSTDQDRRRTQSMESQEGFQPTGSPNMFKWNSLAGISSGNSHMQGETQAIASQQDGQELLQFLKASIQLNGTEQEMEITLPSSEMGLRQDSSVPSQQQSSGLLRTEQIDKKGLTPGQKASGDSDMSSQLFDADFQDANLREMRNMSIGASSTEGLMSHDGVSSGIGWESWGFWPLRAFTPWWGRRTRGQWVLPILMVPGIKAVEASGAISMTAKTRINDAGCHAASWEEVAERMVLVTLPPRGKPYKRLDLEDAVISTRVPTTDIETLGEFGRDFLNIKWRSRHAEWLKSCFIGWKIFGHLGKDYAEKLFYWKWNL